MEQKYWGDDLRRMRKAAKKTTVQMAKRAGVTRQAYELWEKDVGQPKISQFFSLMIFCSMDLDSIKNQFNQLK